MAHGYPTDLWTCSRVAAVIEKEFAISYHPAHLSRILHSMGYSPQKHASEARKRDPKAAAHFREVVWPSKKRGENRNDSCVFIDESGFRLQPLLRRTWAPRGQTGVVKAWDRHDRLTAVTALALTPGRRRVDLYFQMLDHKAKADDFLWFVVMLKREIQRPLIIVWDRRSAHRKAARWFRELDCNWVQFHYPPPYCPELNPVEHVWSTTKWGRLANWPAPDIESVANRVCDDFESQACQHHLMKGHFRSARLDLS
jgi:hypothetical protein